MCIHVERERLRERKRARAHMSQERKIDMELLRLRHGVATISRLLKIMSLLQNTVSFIGLFCKRDL